MLVRRQTFAELWAGIGGLYAAYLMALGFLFSYSGASTRLWQQVRILSCVSEESKAQYLQEYSQYTMAETMQKQIDRMEGQILELEMKNKK